MVNNMLKRFFNLYLWKRSIYYWWQRRTRGWDDTVTWNLDQQLAQWLAPRLKRFQELNNGHPYEFTWKKWNEKLEEMIWSVEYYAKNAYSIDCDKKEYERAQRGLQEVMKYLNCLWW